MSLARTLFPGPASIAQNGDGLFRVFHIVWSWTAIRAPKAGWAIGLV